MEVGNRPGEGTFSRFPWPAGTFVAKRTPTHSLPTQPPDDSLHSVYEKQGLRFAYPENWTAEEDSDSNATAAATVTSPDTAFWTVMYYRGDHDAEQLTEAVLEAFKAEYPQLEVDPADDLDSDGASFGFDLSFSYVDLLSTAMIRSFDQPDGTYLVLCQAEDHELEAVEPVFAAMTASLMKEF